MFFIPSQDKFETSSHTFIIAEAGVNHNGDIKNAKKLIDIAATAGADAVKFQTFKAERLVSATAPKAEYQMQTTDPSESQQEMIRRLELSLEAHQELNSYCQKQGILFMSTPFDKQSVDLLDDLGMPAFKIGSGEVTNLPLLEYIASKGKPLILSTGMSHLGEVDEAVRAIKNAGCDQLILLHCVSNYPANPSDANLKAMETMATAFQLPVGYSDHTPGIEVALAAVALGACVIEKHFTLDKNLPGPDHKASLEPQELEALVKGIRIVEQALGNRLKQPQISESNSRAVARRSLAAVCDIQPGTVITSEILTALRPGSGISPVMIKHLLGRKAKNMIPSGQLIMWSDLSD